MAKKIIKLTEGDLNKIIKESVNNILTEDFSKLEQWYQLDDEFDDEEDEDIEYQDSIDFRTLNDVLESLGWHYYNAEFYDEISNNMYIVYYAAPNNISEYEEDENIILNSLKKKAEIPDGINIKIAFNPATPKYKKLLIKVKVFDK
jgi:hypothetical protein